MSKFKSTKLAVASCHIQNTSKVSPPMSHKFDRSCFGGGLIDTFTIIHNSESGLTKQPPGQARTILSVAGKVDIVV